ncbi:MAG: 30S ribosomal protein S1 [Myxococcota bacterium]
METTDIEMTPDGSEHEDRPRVGIETLKVSQIEAESMVLVDENGSQLEVAIDGASDVSVEPGSSITAFVDREDEPAFASIAMAERLEVYRVIERAASDDTIIEGDVVARVKGGFAVDVGARAFLPMRQATLRSNGLEPDLVGQRLAFKVDTFQPRRFNVVLTRRPILEVERAVQAEQTLNAISEGEVVSGTVVGFTRYGMFVDIGGIDGLVHQSDLHWGRPGDPSQLFSIGESVKTKVLGVERDAQKVQLGVKQLTEDPWLRVTESFPIDQRVQGRVVSLTRYGAFVEVAPGLEGMVHVSEMSWTERIQNPKQKVSPGDSVEVVVLDIDQENRRLSLGLKQATPNPWEDWAKRYKKGTHVKGKVSSITEFGVFIGVEPGLDGLVHVSDIRWNERVDDPSTLFQKGQDVEAVVLKVDPEAQRMSLGVKQLTEDPWKLIARRYPRGTTVKGKVVRVTDFGAFVELEDDVEGMIHVSQLAVERVERPTDVVTVGQEVEAVVTNLDTRQHRIALSIRGLQEGLDNDYRDYLEEEASAFSNSMATAFEKSSTRESEGDE